MKNFGLSDLRLVRPRDGWPNSAAVATASHAADLLQAATLHDSAQEALGDLNYVYAATARSRFMHKPVVTTRGLPYDEPLAPVLPSPHAAVGAAVPPAAAPPPRRRVGIMFGRESSGLTNEEVGLAHKILTIDAHPAYPVLNMAQAVSITCYELYTSKQLMLATAAVAAPGQASAPTQSGHGAAQPAATLPHALPQQQPQQQAEVLQRLGGAARPLEVEPASAAQAEALLVRLVRALDDVGFFESEEKKPSTVLSIRNLLMRVQDLGGSEVQLLHGMLSKLHRPARTSQRAAGACTSAQPEVPPAA